MSTDAPREPYRFNKCPTCEEWGWSDKHVCPPLWLARLSDDDEWVDVYARDSESAAEKYAARLLRESGECFDEYDVAVLFSGGEVQRFIVSCDWEPSFSAWPVDKEE